MNGYAARGLEICGGVLGICGGVLGICGGVLGICGGVLGTVGSKILQLTGHPEMQIKRVAAGEVVWGGEGMDRCSSRELISDNQ
jgi:hypothetical protein